MFLKKNNFTQRTITGILFVLILTGSILSSPLSFGILFIVISLLTLREFCDLLNGIEEVRINKLMVMLGGAYLFLAFMLVCSGIADLRIFIPYLLLIIYLFVSELYLKRENPLLNWAYVLLSQFYTALPYALLNVLAFSPNQDNGVDYHPMVPLSVFVFIWLNDTGAYCVGSLLGKHRLFERISPKKSWEGSIGGGIWVLAFSFIFAHFFPVFSFAKWIGLALTVAVFGTWGDLVESLLKRQLGVKDSGHILPGHGGMLDRFDSALLAIPAAVIYLFVVS
ncbi:Phosphatidate cytidylyltransferase [termite gut metagenome]|uniref:Phosphatidate cytidylyltransferase n=1 Tax=termite gut metagenome TaxID=433724 RepID=A0A5J4T569_9ZZZZ